MIAVAIVIPARWASGRFPGKPLAPIRGPDGESRPLIEWTWRAAKDTPGCDRIVVATDDDRIAAAVDDIGGEVLLTPTGCRNGTERCAAVLNRLDAEVVVNWQGDAPLTPISMAASVMGAFADPAVQVATPMVPCGPDLLNRLENDAEHGRVGGTTAVLDASGKALYFSKNLLPYRSRNQSGVPTWLHVGLYGYRREALAWYADRPEGSLERQEGLEQLRFLEHGVPVTAVPQHDAPDDLWELNNPGDVAPIEAALARRSVG